MFNLRFVWDKVETIVIDRRIWVAVIALVFVLSGKAEDANATDTLSDQAVNWAVLLTAFVNNALWTMRQPSGRLNVVNPLDEILEAVNADE